MSAFTDEPDRFVDWLRDYVKAKGDAEAHLSASDQFVPRRLYGAYIQDLLGNEIWQTGNGRNLYLLPDKAVALVFLDRWFFRPAQLRASKGCGSPRPCKSAPMHSEQGCGDGGSACARRHAASTSTSRATI